MTCVSKWQSGQNHLNAQGEAISPCFLIHIMQSQTDIQSHPAYPLVQQAVSGQETIRWVEAPDPIHAIRKTWITSAFGLGFAGVVSYIFSQIFAINNRTPLSMQPNMGIKFVTWLVLIVFIIVALRFIFSPLWEYLIAKRKVYAITDQRAIIIEQFPSDKQTSYYSNDIKFVQIRGKEIGDIIFDTQMKTVTQYETVPGSNRQRMVRRNVRVSIGFFSVPLPSPASELLKQMKASVQPPVEKQKPVRANYTNSSDRFRQ